MKSVESGKHRTDITVKKKIRIQYVSRWSIALTIVVAIVFIASAMQGVQKFRQTEATTKQYIASENAAMQFKEASDYLTEQVRLFVMTGKNEYMNLYFEEVDFTKNREHALEELEKYFAGSDILDTLQEALDDSAELMDTECYAMRLVCEGTDKAEGAWPERIQNIKLSAEDKRLTSDAKVEKAQTLISNAEYQKAKKKISEQITQCTNSLMRLTRNSQKNSTEEFADLCKNLEIGAGILVILMVVVSLMIRILVIKPLLLYNESIKKGKIFPVVGAAELQSLAETYNRVYMENQETQKLIRHQAEHDALTDLLNRGAYEKLLHIYETGEIPFALLLVDVDTFKSVNDTYGHAVGDAILKRVSDLLTKAFRSIDYVCRIGGDEFAVIMVEMTSNLQYTILDKISAVNEELSREVDGMPAVSLSVGVAFSDRENPGDDIFKDADKALYHVKENGRHGCHIY